MTKAHESGEAVSALVDDRDQHEAASGHFYPHPKRAAKWVSYAMLQRLLSTDADRRKYIEAYPWVDKLLQDSQRVAKASQAR